MRALIAVALWAAISVPLALLVARAIRAAGAFDIADEAERWLRQRSIGRAERRIAMVARSILVLVLLAPLAGAAAVAAWRLPSLMTVTRAEGQLALSWPPGEEDDEPDETPAGPAPVTADAAARRAPDPVARSESTGAAATAEAPAAAAAAHDGGEHDGTTTRPSGGHRGDGRPEEPPTTTTPPAERPTPSSTTPPARCEQGTTSTTSPGREDATAAPSCPDDDEGDGAAHEPGAAESAPEGANPPADTEPPPSPPAD